MKSVDGWEEVRRTSKIIGYFTGKKQYEVMQEAILLYIDTLDEDIKQKIKPFIKK